ncbi:MAG: Hsp20/alpha crystallin family protein [Yoonia sp.]|nr:Hsp20/alpha crystallin family protein [Yoonia sp.]
MLQTTHSPMNFAGPFADMRRMQNAMNQIFDGARLPTQSWTYPPVNLWAAEDGIVITTELAGLTEQDIELPVEDKVLTIRGTYPAPQSGDEIVWHRHERVDGAFSRSVELPFRVNPDLINARFGNGVLTVEMQRPEDAKPKRVQIKSS